MIMEFVEFDLPDGFSDADLLADGLSTVDHWQANPDLIAKHFVRHESGTVMGVYLWPNREAGERAHDAAWVERFKARTGQEPRISYGDVFLMIDNVAGTVTQP